MSSEEPLPPARALLDKPAVVAGADHCYSLPPNTAGQALHLQRRRPKPDPVWHIPVPVPAPAEHLTSAELTASSTASPAALYPLDDTDLSLGASVVADVAMAKLPRTTAWRHKRKLEQGIAPVYRKYKVYTCKKCGQPNTAVTGHSKHRKGFVFCPNLGQTKEEWAAEIEAKISQQ